MVNKYDSFKKNIDGGAENITKKPGLKGEKQGFVAFNNPDEKSGLLKATEKTHLKLC